MSRKKAFTLIELLVVVAIIAILASIVVARLNLARSKGQEAAIRSNLKNMTTQAEIIYTNTIPNSYSTVCANMTNMISAIAAAGGTAGCYTEDGKRWGASAKLNSDITKSWSVSSEGTIVQWDTVDIGSNLDWYVSTSTCASGGGRLPTVEELRARYSAGVVGAGFATDWYWTNTTSVSSVNDAYMVGMGSGLVPTAAKTLQRNARCVK